MYATCRYVLATGDKAVLDESIPFLEGCELNPSEEAYYDQPQRSHETASLYEHCVRAIKRGLRFGEHQLPLMGCGDWNDGMISSARMARVRAFGWHGGWYRRAYFDDGTPLGWVRRQLDVSLKL